MLCKLSKIFYLLVITSCIQDGKPADIPLVGSVVRSNLPLGFKGLIDNDILSDFKNLMNKPALRPLTPQTCSGLIGCTLDVHDKFMNELNLRSLEFNRYCLDFTPVSRDANLFNEFFSSNFQCADYREQNSGVVFGNKDETYSGAMVIRQNEDEVGSSGEYYFGSIMKYNELSSKLDFSSMYFDDLNPSLVSSRYINIKLDNERLELFILGDFGRFGCGSHFLSNGSQILLKTQYTEILSERNCEISSTIEMCFDANSLKELESCELATDDFAINQQNISDLIDYQKFAASQFNFENLSEGLPSFDVESL